MAATTPVDKIPTKYFKVNLDTTTHVLHMQINNPPDNYLTTALYTEYAQLLGACQTDGRVRCIVLSSALDTIFTKGLDVDTTIKLLRGPYEGADAARTAFTYRALLKNFQTCFSAPESVPAPVIIALHGVCTGLANDMALACDIRYAATDCTFCFKEVDAGFAPDVGTLSRGPKAVGNQSLFNELAMTARDFTADEALRLGYCSKVVPGSRDEVVAEALKTAVLIAKKSPVAIASAKRLVLNARDNTVADSLDYTQIWNGAMLQAKDVEQASQSATPEFQPLFKIPGQ